MKTNQVNQLLNPEVSQMAGFSLIETVISMFILSVILMGMAAFSTASMKNQNRQIQTVAGMDAGQDLLEYYRGYYKDQNKFDALLSSLHQNGNELALPTQSKKIKRTTYVIHSHIDNTSIDNNTIKVSAEVKWAKMGVASDSNSLVLSSYIRRRS